MGYTVVYALNRTYMWTSETATRHFIRTNVSGATSHTTILDVSSSSGTQWVKSTTGVTRGTPYTANYISASTNNWVYNASTLVTFTPSTDLAGNSILSLSGNCISISSQTSTSVTLKLKGIGVFRTSTSYAWPDIKARCYSNSSYSTQVGSDKIVNLYTAESTGFSFTGLTAGRTYYFRFYLNSLDDVLFSVAIPMAAPMSVLYCKDKAAMYTSSNVYGHRLSRQYSSSVSPLVTNSSSSSNMAWSVGTLSSNIVNGYTYAAQNAIISGSYSTAYTFTVSNSDLTTSAESILATPTENTISVAMTGWDWSGNTGTVPNIAIELSLNGTVVGRKDGLSYTDWTTGDYTFTGLTAGTDYTVTAKLETSGLTLATKTVATKAKVAGMSVFFCKDVFALWTDAPVYGHQLVRDGTTIYTKTSANGDLQWTVSKIQQAEYQFVGGSTFSIQNATTSSYSYGEAFNFVIPSSADYPLSDKTLLITATETTLNVKMTGWNWAGNAGGYPNIHVDILLNGTTVATSNQTEIAYDTWTTTAYEFTGLTPGTEYTVRAVLDGPNTIIATTTASTRGDGKVHVYTNGSWHLATAYVYHNSIWVKATPYVYLNSASGFVKAVSS